MISRSTARVPARKREGFLAGGKHVRNKMGKNPSLLSSSHRSRHHPLERERPHHCLAVCPPSEKVIAHCPKAPTCSTLPDMWRLNHLDNFVPSTGGPLRKPQRTEMPVAPCTTSRSLAPTRTEKTGRIRRALAQTIFWFSEKSLTTATRGFTSSGRETIPIRPKAVFRFSEFESQETCF
jgi:hypothetical protein